MCVGGCAPGRRDSPLFEAILLLLVKVVGTRGAEVDDLRTAVSLRARSVDSEGWGGMCQTDNGAFTYMAADRVGWIGRGYVFLLLGALLAIVGVAGAGLAAQDAFSLCSAVVAVITYVNHGLRVHVRVTQDASAVT